MRIKKLDRKKKSAIVENWPAPFGHRTPEVRIGQFIFLNAYSCTKSRSNLLVEFERVIDLTPGIGFDAGRVYSRRSDFVYL